MLMTLLACVQSVVDGMRLLKLKSKLLGHPCVWQLSLCSCVVALYSFKYSDLILIVFRGSCSSAPFARKALLWWLGFRLTMVHFLFILTWPTAMKFAGSWMKVGRALKAEGNIHLYIAGRFWWCLFFFFFFQSMLTLSFLADGC